MVVVAIAARRVQFDRPDVIPWLRGICFTSNIGVLCCCFLIHWKIRRKGSPRMAGSTSAIADLEIADSTPLISTAEQRAREEVVREQMTVYKHDRQFLSALYKVPMRALLVIAFLHFYMKSTKSLLLQSILPLKHLWDAEVFQVHIRGRAGSGKLQRPWKQRKSARQLVTEYVDIARGLWKGRYSREKKTE